MRFGLGFGVDARRGVSGAAPAFDPSALFAAGEKGFWVDPSDLSTMWQDAAGTVPVTAAGQPVGRIIDKSGNGMVWTQSTDANRPTLEVDSNGNRYLSGNGVSKWMLSTAALNMSGHTKMLIAAGANITSSATSVMFQHGNYSTSGSVYFSKNGDNVGNPRLRVYSNSVLDFRKDGVALAAGAYVYLATVDFGQLTSGASAATLEANATSLSVTTEPLGATAANASGGANDYVMLHADWSGGESLNGRLYQLIYRGGNYTQDDLDNLRDYVNGKTGAF